MKRNFIYKLSASLLTLTLSGVLLCGCHDDVKLPDITTSPSIEEFDWGKVTSFTLQGDHFNFPEELNSVAVTLIPRDGSTRCFDALVAREGENLRFHMQVPSDEAIPDGNYVLTMSSPEGRSIPGRLSASFEGGLLASVGIIIPKFMLDGSGTEEDPYLIQNDDDFGMFLINLCDDVDVYGAGLKFLQTADVKAPDQSSLIPGRGYWGAPFAGIYDGGGHEIRYLYYHGGKRESSDSGIGLFTSLLGSASVENLSMTGVSISGLYKESGVIAGRVSGNVTLSNISLFGFIEDGYAIGGLVGCINEGTLNAKTIDLQIKVSGTNDVGGLVGRVDNNATFNLDGLRSTDTHFSVTGNKSVGGIVGRSKGAVNLTDVKLDHKVSSEDSDIDIIHGSMEGAGGIIGTITSEARDHRFKGCHVLCPVGGEGNNIGGIFGQVMSHNNVVVEDCRVYSVVRGKNNVGGLIGLADMPSNVKGITIEGSDYSTRIVADDADAKVTGADVVGGFAGSWKGPLTMNSKVRINLPVTGEKQVGGVFGSIYDSTLQLEGFISGPTSGNNTMKVKGETNVGGIVGYVQKSTLKGDSKFDYADSSGKIRVPSPDSFNALFTCLVEGNEAVGGLIGCARESNLHYLCSEAVVTGTYQVGGIVGWFIEPAKSTNIEDCTFKGRLNCSAAKDVGGIVGYYQSKQGGLVHDCVNYSSVTGGENTAGIIGLLEKGYTTDGSEQPVCDIKWCVNMGEVHGNYYVGGIVGRHDLIREKDMALSVFTNFHITNCMNGAPVKGEGTTTSYGGVGGIIGYSSCYIYIGQCANHGEITGNGPFHGIGGIAGSLGLDPPNMGIVTGYRNLDLKECCNTASVTSNDSGSEVGGILGYQEEGNKSDVSDCHNLGAIPCDQKHDTGGIVGCVDHMTTIRRVVNQGKVSHGNATIGTHKTGSLFDHSGLYFLDGTGSNWPSATKVSEANFKKESSFSDLNFTNTWEMGSNGPVLRNCRWRDSSLAKISK